SNLSGRVLADLITGANSSLTALPMTRHTGPNWEIEPFRFLATRLAERGAMRIDARGARTGTPPTGRTLTERLISH
ncbi:MAG TPA: FAD-dependent oxidoreductase, partial [Acidimicrobiia bacterium]